MLMMLPRHALTISASTARVIRIGASGIGAFMERGVDLPDGRVVDPAGRGGVRGRPSSGANVGMTFLELALDAVAVDGVEKADPFSRSGTTTLMCPSESNENMRALKFEC